MERLHTANKRLKTAHDDLERDYNSQVDELKCKEKELLHRLSELEEMKLNVAQINGRADAADEDVVEINAGGKIIVAKRGTLCQIKGSRLEALFSGRWEKRLQRDGCGRIFLDVNPKCFRAIVDYLNEMAISSIDYPPDYPSVDEEYALIISHQMEFFGLYSMPASNIIKTKAQADQLHAWMMENESDGELSLLYRSSRDGVEPRNFHNACDDKECTLTIIETENGLLVGGYSNMPWSSSNNSRSAGRAFLFVLAGGDISTPCKLKMNDKYRSRGGIGGYSGCGPAFGRNGTHFDLMVENNSNVSFNFGNTYASHPSPLLRNRRWKVKEVEVFQVVNNTKGPVQAETEPITRFSDKINEALNEKMNSLVGLESDVISLEKYFADEEQSFAHCDTSDVVTLNVSGTIMATERSTLLAAESSVLAQQFDDSKWTEQGCSNLRVKEWAPDGVTSWIKNINDMPGSIANIFAKDKITGRELLALGKEEMYKMGIERPATVGLLFDEITKLKEASADVTLIEHSPYCFGKILDHLRLKNLQSRGLANEPALPIVSDSQKSRFEKVTRYYFPGESARYILG